MKIINHNSFKIIQPSKSEIVDKKELVFDFFKEFSDIFPNFNEDNLIIDFSNIINTDLEEILLFSHLNAEHKKRNKSFVIVCNGIDIDDLTNDIMVVPTLTEAEDIVEIENIERDLGI